ncbi:MAG: hypothetical protein EOM59_14885 [Clostridia bacterium]|nr:hypothetical protein [Clostridia bacterium]
MLRVFAYLQQHPISGIFYYRETVPAHLRDAHYRGAESLGHGAGYRYAHDDPRGVTPQRHLPEGLEGSVYYRPTGHGNERQITARLERIRQILAED